jgi:SAM-dependent methyltransferase
LALAFVRGRNVSEKYVHGYSNEEQKRLLYQAELLSSFLHVDLPFENSKHLLEIGCGVGAQTKLLLNKFPNLKITGVDYSKTQIAAAAEYLAAEIDLGRVELVCGDARQVLFDDEFKTFDCAYVCFVLEHVSEPERILQQAYSNLCLNSPIVCTEVMNFTLYSKPNYKSIEAYWSALNELQNKYGGNPNIGVELGSLLHNSGFVNIETFLMPSLLDKRDLKHKKIFLEYWQSLFASAFLELRSGNYCTEATLAEAMDSFEKLKENADSVFFYSPMRGIGYKR